MASGSVGMDDILLLAIFITIPKMHIISICFSIPDLFRHPHLSTSSRNLFYMLLENKQTTNVGICDDM